MVTRKSSPTYKKPTAAPRKQAPAKSKAKSPSTTTLDNQLSRARAIGQSNAAPSRPVTRITNSTKTPNKRKERAATLTRLGNQASRAAADGQSNAAPSRPVMRITNPTRKTRAQNMQAKGNKTAANKRAR